MSVTFPRREPRALPVSILVVDDDEYVRKAISSLLETRPNFKVCGEATNGEEAVQKAVQLSPSLIVMDLSMPVLDGFSATKIVRKALPDVLVLILSFHNGGHMARASQLAAAHGFLSKSDAADDLLTAVDVVVQGLTFFKSK